MKKHRNTDILVGPAEKRSKMTQIQVSNEAILASYPFPGNLEMDTSL